MCILGLGSCSCFQKLRPSLSPAPSETGPKLAERGGTALLVSVAKITLKAGSVYYLNLVQLSEAIISVLVAHAPPSTHLQQLQGGPQICIVPCHAMYVSSNCHYSHHGHYSHGPCSHHTRGAAILTIPASHSQKSVAVCPMLLATSLSPR